MATQIKLALEGITCAHCARGIEDHLKEIGLSDARVDFTAKSANFTERTDPALSEVINSLTKIGYKARIFENNTGSKRKPSTLSLLTIFCSLLAAPLVFAKLFHLDFFHIPIVQLTLTLPIMLSGGVYFSQSAFRSLRLKKPNMDILIALGTWSAFVYSLAGTILNLGPDFLFYETSASIIAIVLIGNFIEARAVRKTEDSLTKLQELRPDSIRLRKSGGTEISLVKLELVQLGDEIILSPGDRIPTDGEIIEGFGELDESFLTGESLPRSATIKDIVYSGALLVGGNIVIKATAVGEESSLVKIIRTIQDARAAKPSLERLADRLTNIFVPIVLVLALVTFVLNLAFGISPAQSLLRAIAVLVISCPCALGLATPTAVTVALGLASRLGILVRKAAVFETLPKATHFCFDKTGTLTDGKFRIEKFESLRNDINGMKKLILGLEAFSHHPIALALRDYCLLQNSHLESAVFSKVDERRGFGVFGESSTGIKYELSSRQIDLPYHLALRENDQIIGRIQLSDSLRKEAAITLTYLQSEKIEISILSGDNAERTQEVASALSIREAKSRLLPEDKAREVALREQIHRVVFVGDGINDAAALSRASVGVTFGAASDLARQSADVTIISGGLEKIAYLRQLSQKTTASIKQNLFWAFFYNIIFIPFAALGLLSPMHAAFAMVLSDLIVVANSLRLKLWQPKIIS